MGERSERPTVAAKEGIYASSGLFLERNHNLNSKINNLTGLGVCSCRRLPQRRSGALLTKKWLSSRSIQPRLWIPERMESEGILSQGDEPSILPATQKRVQK